MSDTSTSEAGRGPGEDAGSPRDREAALLDAARSGDRTSFAMLLEPHLATLRGVVHRMIGHPEDAEDLIQDAQLRAFSKLDGFRGDSGFGSWLIAIATRACIDHLRKEARWRPFAQSFAEKECEAHPPMREEVPDGRQGPESASLGQPLGESPTSDPADDRTEASFRVRLRVVRDHDVPGGVSQPLHDLLYQRIRTLERRTAAAE